MRARRTLLLGAVVLAGCGDIIGLDGYTGDDASVVDATGSDAAGDVVGQDVKNDVTPVDAGSDVVEAGCAGPEFACVPPLPSGWAWAVYNPDARPACATGYVSPTDVEEGIDASAATCGCTCTTTDPSCTTNKLTITAGSNVACNNVTNGTSTSGAGCNTTNFTTAAGSSISVTGPTPSGGSCTPVPKETLPEAGVDHQGRTCTTDAGGAPGCSGGDICMPNPAPFNVCVSQAGVQSCPAGFPNSHLVGTTLTDTRSCSTCGCAFDAGACNGTATFYTNHPGCSLGAQAVPVDGVCTAATAQKYVGYTYAATSTASCAASAVSPDGGVVFADETTVCCQ
jgi:hypothetical protein